MTDIKKLRTLAEKATPGPWRFKTNVHPETNGMPWGFLTGPSQNITWSANKPSTVRDAEFIATANPQAIINLLDRLERYEEALREIYLYAIDADHRREIAREALEGGK